MTDLDRLFDAAATVDVLLPMFGHDLGAVAAAVDKSLDELISSGQVTERHRHECLALHIEILRRQAATG
jgi:hypothetical protein